MPFVLELLKAPVRSQVCSVSEKGRETLMFSFPPVCHPLTVLLINFKKQVFLEDKRLDSQSKGFCDTVNR